MGQETASAEPYLIQSGPYRELVISQPDHIREFYEADAKRELSDTPCRNMTLTAPAEHEKPKNFNFGEPFGR